MKWMTESTAPDLTARGRQLRADLGPKLRRFYEPTMWEPVPSSFLRLIDALQYPDERPKGARATKAEDASAAQATAQAS
jgi:hypothetical protein